MGRKANINWNGEDVRSILSDRSLSLTDMATAIGVKSIYNVSRKRRELGITERCYGNGLGRPLTNKERKARYNAKIKEYGYKPLKYIKYE